jgi:hypothetical protein
MSHVFKLNEWQSPTGRWFCNDVSDLGHGSGAWYLPARILNISLTDFILLLKNEYNVSHIKYNQERDVLVYSWNNQNDMRRYKNFINAKARQINFII